MVYQPQFHLSTARLSASRPVALSTSGARRRRTTESFRSWTLRHAAVATRWVIEQSVFRCAAGRRGHRVRMAVNTPSSVFFETEGGRYLFLGFWRFTKLHATSSSWN